ncbi:MAG TPA: hypothetical protein VLV18_04150 [Terriglobales bacterium]|nr:hypothetical protein [Terriglobales bacterium]
MDPVVLMNLLFDLIIVILGIAVYTKKKGILLMWVSIAFLFFALSYVLVVLGVTDSMVLIPLRAIGYLSVIAGIVLCRRHAK